MVGIAHPTDTENLSGIKSDSYILAKKRCKTSMVEKKVRPILGLSGGKDSNLPCLVCHL